MNLCPVEQYSIGLSTLEQLFSRSQAPEEVSLLTILVVMTSSVIFTFSGSVNVKYVQYVSSLLHMLIIGCQ